MKRIIFRLTAAAIFLTCLPLFAEGSASGDTTSDFNYSQMVKFVDSLPARVQDIYQPHPTGESIWSHEVIPSAFVHTFNRLQAALFGDVRPLKLESCAGCSARTDFEDQTIYVQVSYLERIESDPEFKDGQEAAAFIIAHELGHVIQGLSVHSGNELDINGLPSLMTTSFGADASDASLQPFFLAHAEVDAYGLIVMKKAGFKRFHDAYATLETMRLQGDHWNNLDIDTRLSRITQSVDEIWGP